MINIKNIIKQNIIDFLKNGGNTMFSYKFSDNQIDLDKNSEKDEIFEKLKEVDNKFNYATTPNVSEDEPSFEKKTYEAPSESEIEEMAKNSLSSYKDKSLQDIENDYSKKFKKIDDKTQDLLEDKQNDMVQVFNDYENSVNKTTNSVIKNGLAHSSIFQQAIKEIEDDKNLKLSESEKKFGYELKKLESEKSILENQKDSALASFDISYALKLNDEIAKINSDIAKKQDEVLKYNNQIEKEANELKLKKEQEIAKQNENLTKLLTEKGLVEVNKMKQQEKYEIVKNYLDKLPKAQALAELQDEKFQQELANYYPTLFAEIYSRNE